MEVGGTPAALGGPAGQSSGHEGCLDAVCVPAGSLATTEVDPVTAAAGGTAKHGSSLGLSGGGEGGVAHHHQSGVEAGGSNQLLQCGVVDMGQAEKVDGVLPGQLLQDDSLPQGWKGSQSPLHSADHVPGRLDDQILVITLRNSLEVRDVRGW